MVKNSLGYPVAVIQAILRHKSPGTTGICLTKLGVENVRPAQERLEETREGFDLQAGEGF